MIKLLGDKVLIKPIVEESKSDLILVESKKKKPTKGEVIVLGSSCVGEEQLVSVGDIVLYGEYGMTPITFEDIEYLIMSQLDIIAIVD